MALKRADQLTGVGIPDLDRAVSITADDYVPIGRKGESSSYGELTVEVGEKPPIRGVPQLAYVNSGGDCRALWVENDLIYEAAVTLLLAKLMAGLSACDINEYRQTSATAAGQKILAWAECE